MNELSNIDLTIENLKKYLNAPQDKSDTELEMDLELARQRGLNPFIGDMYFAQNGKLALTKQGETLLASRVKNFKAPTGGIVVLSESGELINRIGTVKLPTDKIIGGWAKIESLGYENSVSFYEYYAGAYVLEENLERKKDEHGRYMKKQKSNGNAMGENTWDKKPATMIRKVAIVQALREAYPQTYTGFYDESEQGFEETANFERSKNIKKVNEIIEEF